jgi:Na+/H+ antiporter NhaD/arsenite permease-like protein
LKLAIAPLLIFALTYLVLAIGRLPGFRIDRTGATIIGGSAFVGLNLLTVDQAFRSINHDTLVLLFGMMIVVANLRLSGFFGLVSEWVVERAHHPLALLSAIVMVSGVFSAFFVNDTMCIVLTPLVVEIATSLRRNPMPYALAVAMGANIGSVATITGNPQNMMIGSFSGIGYRDFSRALAPVAAIGLLIAILVLAFVYRSEIFDLRRVEVPRRRIRVNRVLLWKSVVASLGMIVLFFVGWPVPKVALIAGALLLVTRRVKPEKVYREIDWSLLVLFVGLFVVVAGLENSTFQTDLERLISHLHLENIAVLTIISAALSNLVSNVPAVLLFKPFIPHLTDPQRAWLTLAMSSTLAGNLTLVGSMANLIVVQRARPELHITFFEYLRAGVPITVLTLLAGVAILAP